MDLNAVNVAVSDSKSQQVQLYHTMHCTDIYLFECAGFVLLLLLSIASVAPSSLKDHITNKKALHR